MQFTPSNTNRKPLLIWLAALICMVMIMVIVGGLTRLTDSGLSMVDWQPIHGTLPPIGAAEWQEEFDYYKTSPQYKLQNFDMTVEEFKGIFGLEYLHRLLGRVVGLIFFIPFIYFLFCKTIPPRYALKLGGIFLLGGAQGLLGWYMVKSGLVNEPMVSPLRLAAHLSMACLLFTLLYWQWLRVFQERKTSYYSRMIISFIALIFVQIILGALVAGQDAGLAYDSFPTMNGAWIPDGLGLIEPWWKNLYQSPTTAQWIHRAGALVLTVYLIFIVMRYQKRTQLNTLVTASVHALIIVLILQIALGAFTVIYHVPIALAAAHQFAALLLLAAAVSLLYGDDDAKRLTQ